MEKSDAFLVPVSVGCLCSLCCQAIPNYHPLGRSMVPKERGWNPFVGSQCSDLEARLKVVLLSNFLLSPSCLFRLCRRGMSFCTVSTLNKSVGATVILKRAVCPVASFSAGFLPTRFNRWFYASICETELKNTVHDHCNACFLQAINQCYLNLGKG